MRVIRLFILGCLVTFTALAQETLRPEQLTPGMKGYGLSVFRGTKPERFEVEILGVLKNAFPKQDMILIRMSGANLEHHKVIAGMSGSPIYIDGKLIGALAYGWTFENDPLAGVTPIHNMLAEIDRKAEPGLAPAPATRASSEAALQPLLTPLALGGFSPRVIAQMAEEFRPYGLLPVAGGGASGALKRSDADFEPGGAIGVQLMRGDLDATGVGTVSYVDKKRGRVLAFGHPFLQAGLISAPAVHAEVHVVMSSLQRSFKMASPVSERGAMVGDWQSCIVADTATTARMIPVVARVVNRGTGHNEQYALEVIDHPVFTPRLIVNALAEVIGSASGSSQDTMLQVRLTAVLSDRSITLTNTFFHPSGGLFNSGSVMPIAQLFSSPFGRPQINSAEIHVEATLERRTADIKRAYFEKAQVERGEKAKLHVVLKPFGQPEQIRTIPVTVPAATDTLRELVVVVTSGATAPADVAAPDSLDDYLRAIQKRHRSTDLVAVIQTAGQGLQYRGKLLRNLPPSALGVLGDDNPFGPLGAADVQQLVTPTGWVLSGTAVARVPIRQE
ncbi:MAG: hypothetical protein FJ395_01705 [Verrucomicrobia bacterium]|nr:hypothetical protein [Verrucomicrobiota bacterium]